MTKIDELIKFKPKTKAVADEVNSNFEKLLVACNEHDDSISDIQTQINELKSNNTQEIICENNVLELNDTTNNFKILGESSITEITGLTNGFVIL